MENIRSLEKTSLSEIYTAWEDAFSDYASSWTVEELERMLSRRGYDPALSFGAFDGDKLVSFTLNGIGNYNGIPTAYDTGTGTVAAYRGKGLAKQIFAAAVPPLIQTGVRQYLLEVLQNNEAAITLYTNAGFTISREFNYFVHNTDKLQWNNKTLPQEYNLQHINLDMRTEMETMCDFPPSWQNNFDALLRCPDRFYTVGAFINNTLAGYGIIEPFSGDIPQLAVHAAHRRNGVGTAIFKDLAKHTISGTLRFINADTRCTTLTAFLSHHGIPITGTQYEMVKETGSVWFSKSREEMSKEQWSR